MYTPYLILADEDDLRDVMSAVADLAGRWQNHGVSLGIHLGDLEAIISVSADAPSDCLRKVLTLWLRQNYKVWTMQLHTCLFRGYCWILWLVGVKVETSFKFNPLPMLLGSWRLTLINSLLTQYQSGLSTCRPTRTGHNVM